MLIITNNVYTIKKEINKQLETMIYKDMNFEKVISNETEEILKKINNMPFIDKKRVLLIEIVGYSMDFKQILSKSMANQYVEVIFVYYSKNRFDKGDKKLLNLFKENKQKIITALNIDMKEVAKMLRLKNLDLDCNLFNDADNLDVVFNDINKISSLKDFSNVKRYLSESYTRNVFDLIDSINSKKLDRSLELIQILKNESQLNSVLLKYYMQIRRIKELAHKKASIREELYRIEKVCTGKGSFVNNYRIKCLEKVANSCSMIFLEKVINILLENDIKKNWDLETTLVKIMAA